LAFFEYYRIRSPWFFIFWSRSGAPILTLIPVGTFWSPDAPPADLNYPTSDNEFREIGSVLGSGVSQAVSLVGSPSAGFRAGGAA